MLSELIIVCIFGLITMLIGVICFKKGIEYGMRVFLTGYEANTGKKLEVKEPTKRKKKTETTETKEQIKRNILMANINAFDGTTIGQQEIK